MLKVYAKKVYHNMGYDVIIYRDAQLNQIMCKFDWYSTNKPTMRNKYITLNCNRWQIEWV
jgi:hypothetical protein